MSSSESAAGQLEQLIMNAPNVNSLPAGSGDASTFGWEDEGALGLAGGVLLRNRSEKRVALP